MPTLCCSIGKLRAIEPSKVHQMVREIRIYFETEQVVSRQGARLWIQVERSPEQAKRRITRNASKVLARLTLLSEAPGQVEADLGSGIVWLRGNMVGSYLKRSQSIKRRAETLQSSFPNLGLASLEPLCRAEDNI